MCPPLLQLSLPLHHLLHKDMMRLIAYSGVEQDNERIM
nr:hypothetical protein Q903MT_gene1996 [Picea sitchensis]